MRTIRSLAPIGLFGLLLTTPATLLSQGANPDPGRFSEAISRFADWDSQNAWPHEGVVFVGSSSIVRWSTRERFEDLPVINRGFGGSHISDVNHFIEETVLRYGPEVVVFYAGNNDIAAGKSADQVFADYQHFVGRVHSRHPAAQILFISTHPSLLRWEHWPEMQRLNASVLRYSEANPALHYADITAGMLGADGRPRPELFVEDGLHLTEAGYDVWTPIVARGVASLRKGWSR